MLFHRFASQEERRAFGGSDFLELQPCPLPPSSTPEELVSIDNFLHWQLSSLYISGDDMGLFQELYGPLLGHGLYNNLSTGPLDPCGINYYTPAQAAAIIARIEAAQPQDCQLLLPWLRENSAKGFYLLGV